MSEWLIVIELFYEFGVAIWRIGGDHNKIFLIFKLNWELKCIVTLRWWFGEIWFIVLNIWAIHIPSTFANLTFLQGKDTGLHTFLKKWISFFLNRRFKYKINYFKGILSCSSCFSDWKIEPLIVSVCISIILHEEDVGISLEEAAKYAK